MLQNDTTKDVKSNISRNTRVYPTTFDASRSIGIAGGNLNIEVSPEHADLNVIDLTDYGLNLPLNVKEMTKGEEPVVVNNESIEK